MPQNRKITKYIMTLKNNSNYFLFESQWYLDCFGENLGFSKFHFHEFETLEEAQDILNKFKLKVNKLNSFNIVSFDEENFVNINEENVIEDVEESTLLREPLKYLKLSNNIDDIVIYKKEIHISYEEII